MSGTLKYLIGGVGELLSGFENRAALKSSAAMDKLEAGIALSQGYADEEAQRRQARQIMGEQAAAIAQSGGGVGLEDLVRQSATNAELDALNIRYGARVKATGLFSRAAAAKAQSKSIAPFLMAGGELLRGYGDYKRSLV